MTLYLIRPHFLLFKCVYWTYTIETVKIGILFLLRILGCNVPHAISNFWWQKFNDTISVFWVNVRKNSIPSCYRRIIILGHHLRTVFRGGFLKISRIKNICKITALRDTSCAHKAHIMDIFNFSSVIWTSTRILKEMLIEKKRHYNIIKFQLK